MKKQVNYLNVSKSDENPDKNAEIEFGEIKQSNERLNPSIDYSRKSFSLIRDKDRHDNYKLQMAIKINGFKQICDFASVCGFSASFISKIMHGWIKPTFNQAQIITSNLKLSVFDVFTRDEIRDYYSPSELAKGEVHMGRCVHEDTKGDEDE